MMKIRIHSCRVADVASIVLVELICRPARIGRYIYVFICVCIYIYESREQGERTEKKKRPDAQTQTGGRAGQINKK